MSPIPKTHLQSEGDVTALAGLILINRINCALNDLCSRLIEGGRPRARAEIRCTSEHQKGTCCQDLSSKLCMSKDAAFNRPITRKVLAVLDFKCTLSNHETDFEPAISDTLSKLSGKLEETSEMDSKTLLERNAVDLSIKPAKYAEIMSPLVLI